MLMEIVIQLVAFGLALVLALIASMRFTTNGLSTFELDRQLQSGSDQALAEQKRRALLSTFMAFNVLKQWAIIVAIFVLLFATHSVVIAAALSALYLLLAKIIESREWFLRPAGAVQRWAERVGTGLASVFAPYVKWIAPKPQITSGQIASREELSVFLSDTKILSPQDRDRLMAAINFGGLLVVDAMVPRDKIDTVDLSETVGPVLLDRLHKRGHKMFLVVKKNLDHVKGWLYMADLVPLDPQIKTVQDATRPKVHSLPVNAPLQDVLVASVQTGRQMFLVVNQTGGVDGLITLADVLARINGQPLPKEAPVSVQANK